MWENQGLINWRQNDNKSSRVAIDPPVPFIRMTIFRFIRKSSILSFKKDPHRHHRQFEIQLEIRAKYLDISGLPESFSVLVQFWGRTWRGFPRSHLPPPSPPLFPCLSLFQPQPVSCWWGRNKLQTPSLTCSFRSHSRKTSLTAFRLPGHICFFHFSKAWAASKL